MKKVILLLLGIFTISCSKDDSNEETKAPYVSVQAKLNSGKTPIELYNTGIILDSLYGKQYKGGYIFYLNTIDGSGFVTGFQDNSGSINWGSFADVTTANNTQINFGIQNTTAITNYYNLTNTAADFCENLTLNGFSDWFLPSKDEMSLMMSRLKNIEGIFFGAVTGYWTSSNYDFNNVWIIKSDNSASPFLKFSSSINFDIRIRAARKFNN